MTPNQTMMPPDTQIGTPPALGFVTLERSHAQALLNILKRTSRASAVENDWILHTIDTLTSQLARNH